MLSHILLGMPRMQGIEVLYLDHFSVLCLQHTTLRNVVKSLSG